MILFYLSMNYINHISKLIIICLIFQIVEKSKFSKEHFDKFQELNIKNSINKTINDISEKTEGITSTIEKENSMSNKLKKVKDVIIINGCNPKNLPHPYRYRVLHQMEQLNAGFLESDEFYYINFDPIIIIKYRILIFYRCPWTPNVEKAIMLAKNLNKKILFDIDDLVIDLKYTNILPFLKTLTQKEKYLYDKGVIRMGKTLKLCDGAITTTKILARELKNYVPNVFINRNVASEEMWKLSQKAMINKLNIEVNNKSVIIGYLSGSITHNPDLEMIKPALKKILREYKDVKFLICGDINTDLIDEFPDKVIKKTFIDWRKLPEIISNIDINIAPLVNNIFNQAKSENKWLEAALVKVPTVASNIGSFKNIIQNKITGFKCRNNNEWYRVLKKLIRKENLRKEIGENAYNFCKKKYNTLYTGRKLVNFINSFANKHIGFFLPSLQLAGGIYVILKHACILQDEGWDVDIILPSVRMELLDFQGHKFNLVSLDNTEIESQYDTIVATLYTTVYKILNYFKTKKKLYLVQGYETDFFPFGHYFRAIAEKTYSMNFGIEYITISKWCQNWLHKKYKKNCGYAPNGIDSDNYSFHRRILSNKKIRILIEGDSSSFYKNIDESFKITEKLDKRKYEIWYLSNLGKPKDWYKIDKFLYKIPYDNVKHIYEECDILIKSSWLESFSYPPLEMMATGGFCIAVSNSGNNEYLKDGENCLIYKLGDINDALKCIERLISDEKLQQHLYENGLITAKNRDWKNFRKKIINLYNN